MFRSIISRTGSSSCAVLSSHLVTDIDASNSKVTLQAVAIFAILGLQTLLCYTRLQGNLQREPLPTGGGQLPTSSEQRLLLKIFWMLHLGRSARSLDVRQIRWSSTNPAWVSPNLKPSPPLLDKPSFSPPLSSHLLLILLPYLLFNSGISFSATALLLSYYSCVGIIVECALQ